MTWKERLVRFRSFWIFPALSIVLIGVTYRPDAGNRLSDLFWSIPLGLLAWTLLEYGLHRFIFHIDLPYPRVQSFLGETHIGHHRAPRDIAHLLVHTGYALSVSSIVAALVFVAARDLFVTAGVMTGIWIGFLYYESVHYRVHATSANRGLIRAQRHAHFQHHYHDSENGFGVTSPLWDYVFGTRPEITGAARAQRQ